MLGIGVSPYILNVVSSYAVNWIAKKIQDCKNVRTSCIGVPVSLLSIAYNVAHREKVRVSYVFLSRFITPPRQQIRDVREWLSTFPFLPFPSIQFPFPPIPIPIFVLFPFPWDSRVGYSHSLPFPFPILCFIPFPMGFPWDSRSHWESHSHAHLYNRLWMLI